jgi:predicted nucleotidyltransferase
MDKGKMLEIKSVWKKREQRKQEQERNRRDHAWKCAERVAALLREKYGIKKLWLFGSLVSGKHFTVHSDIDLFVEDFPANADFWVVLGQAEHAAAPFPLNLILEENALPKIKEIAHKEGVLL